MFKNASYDDPSELPIEISACDPLDGDLLFGLLDKPDEIRESQNAVTTKPGRQLEKEAATKTQVERLARQLEQHVNPDVGPRLRRYIARTQAAMQLGMSFKEMSDVFYSGRQVADPFQIAHAGYPAEARFAANPIQDSVPSVEPGAFVEMSDLSVDTSDGLLDGLMDATPAEPVTTDTQDQFETVHQLAAAQDSWHDFLLLEAAVTLQPQDEVLDDQGKSGKVTTVDADGTVTVEMADPAGPKEIKYNPDAIEQGQISRKQTIANGWGLRTIAVEPVKPKKVVPRAPAGMTTEDGDLQESDETKGKEIVSSVKVTFPNLEMRDWSRRPPFVYGWYKNVKQAATRLGGELVLDDPTSRQLTAIFRQMGLAREFALRLAKDFHLQTREIEARATMSKTAAVDPAKAAETWKRAHEHADTNPDSEIAKWVADSQAWMNPLTVLTGTDPVNVLAENPDKLQELEMLLLQAEQQVREQEQMEGAQSQEWTEKGKAPLMFNPEDYVDTKQGRLYRTVNAQSVGVGDRVAVATDGETQTGQVVSVVGSMANVMFDDENVEQTTVPLTQLSKISKNWISLSDLPADHWVGTVCRDVAAFKKQSVVKATQANTVKVIYAGQTAGRWVQAEDLLACVNLLSKAAR